jgi:hypothetical protein
MDIKPEIFTLLRSGSFHVGLTEVEEELTSICAFDNLHPVA